jgi:hypothetical protein
VGESNARIVWHRKPGFNSSAVAWKIRIDENERGEIRNGKTLAIDVDAGEHCIQVGFFKRGSTPSNQLQVRFDAGQEIYISSTISLFSGRIELQVDRTVIRKIVETDSYEVQVGNDEVRVIDNLQGVSPIVRTFHLTREWSKSYSTGTVQSDSASKSVQLEAKLSSIKMQAERRIEQQYGTTSQQRQAFEDTVAITAAPHTYSEIRFTWKEIRQRGYVEEIDGVTHISRTPFELITGLTFDQRQVDRNSL